MKKKGLNMEQKRSLTGWAFLLPAALLIFVFCFYPMVQALILSFQKGTGSAVQPAGSANYVRILKDATFQQCLFNTIFYFVIQVPIMLILALILAQLLNSPNIKGKGIYRTMIFLPCATSLVSYSMIFKSLFANDGLVNRVLSTVGIPFYGAQNLAGGDFRRRTGQAVAALGTAHAGYQPRLCQRGDDLLQIF